MDYMNVESPIGHDQVQQKARRMELPKIGTLQQNCVPDFTLETQGHVGTALDGLLARNTFDCLMANNVHVPNIPGLPRTEYLMIIEMDLAATTEPDMTQIGAPMSLQSTCSPTTSEKGMKMCVQSKISKGMSLPDEAKEK